MNSPSPALRQTVATLLLVAVCSLPTTGCYTFHAYQAGGPDGREMGNRPSTEWTNTTRHALAWGLIRQDIAVENCVLANGQRLGIEEVKVETNFGWAIHKTPVGERWYFRDFADSPDERFRKIVKRFADAGYVKAERDEFVTA